CCRTVSGRPQHHPATARRIATDWGASPRSLGNRGRRADQHGGARAYLGTRYGRFDARCLDRVHPHCRGCRRGMVRVRCADLAGELGVATRPLVLAEVPPPAPGGWFFDLGGLLAALRLPPAARMVEQI